MTACGGGSSLSGPVVDLSTDDQESLCDDFVASICAKPDFASFCDACVTSTGCAMAATMGAIEAECAAPYTAEMVQRCGDTGDSNTCLGGGGCMFDAIEEVCP